MASDKINLCGPCSGHVAPGDEPGSRGWSRFRSTPANRGNSADGSNPFCDRAAAEAAIVSRFRIHPLGLFAVQVGLAFHFRDDEAKTILSSRCWPGLYSACRCRCSLQGRRIVDVVRAGLSTSHRRLAAADARKDGMSARRVRPQRRAGLFRRLGAHVTLIDGPRRWHEAIFRVLLIWLWL